MPSVRLIIIDPVSAYLGKTDSNNNSEIRGLLGPLSDMAAKHCVAILLVTHLNKSKDQNMIGRVIGSVGLIAAARSGFAVVKDQTKPEIRYFLPIKNNIGNDSEGFSFEIEGVDLESGIHTSRIRWHSSPVNAHRILNEDKSIAKPGPQAFLLDFLANGGKTAPEVLQAAAEKGFNEGKIRRAADKLGIIHQKGGFGSGWLWVLPLPATIGEDCEDAEDINTP